jgi:hypothetical protein
MEEAFLALLAASSGVTSHVPASRINWGSHPQGTGSPYIVLTVISDNEGLTYTGPDGLSQGRVQVDCYAPDYAGAKLASRAVRILLHGYRGNGFQLIEHAGSRDSREGGTNEAERLHRTSLDFMTHFWRQT